MVDVVWGKAHTGRSMGARLDDYVDSSKRTRSPASRARREVFRQAYSLAVELMELRIKRGLTQQKLSEATGIAQSEISRIERGATSPTHRTMERLAGALGAEIRLVETSSSAS